MIGTSAATRAPSRIAGMVHATLPFATIAAFLFAATFNLQPDLLRYVLTAVLGAYLLVCASAVIGGRVPGQGLALVALSGFLALNFIHIVILGKTDTLYYFAQYLFAFLVSTVFFLPNSNGLSRRQISELFLAVVLVFAVAVFQAYYFDPLIRGTTRLAPFNGGPEGLHPSAYAVLAYLAFFALAYRRLPQTMKWLNLAAFAIGLLTIEMYGVRTAELGLAVAVLTVGVFAAGLYYGIPLGNIVIAFASYVLPTIIAIVLYLVFSVDDLSQELLTFSSGRTVAYEERLAMFMDRSLFDQIIGGGAGSDFVTGMETWRATAKDSHNDFLSFLLEYGVIGFLIFCCWCLAMLLSSRSVLELAVLAGLIVASFVSNGVLLRPTLFMLFAFAVVVLRMAPVPAQPRTGRGRRKRRPAHRAPRPRRTAAARLGSGSSYSQHD